MSQVSPRLLFLLFVLSCASLAYNVGLMAADCVTADCNQDCVELTDICRAEQGEKWASNVASTSLCTRSGVGGITDVNSIKPVTWKKYDSCTNTCDKDTKDGKAASLIEPVMNQEAGNVITKCMPNG